MEIASNPTSETRLGDTDVQPVTTTAAPAPSAEEATAETNETRLSYKFQRLREKLREAIRSGEFQGKLPGERQLAKRFNVNAKTLSKALTDLAAEGLLDRSIGRGTFVKGSAPAAAGQGRWLALVDPSAADSPLVRRLRQANPDLVVCSDFAQIRPSFLSPFSAVLDLSGGVPEGVVRDLVVRNLPFVAVGHEPRTFAMHCVLPDVGLAGMKLGRDLLLGGHRRLVAVEAAGRHGLTHALRQSAQRYAPDATVDACTVQEVATLLGDGAVAFVCESVHAARLVRTIVAENATGDVAVAAVGCAGEGEYPCSGYYVDSETVAEAVGGLLADPPARPTTIWLTCAWADRGTMVPSTAPPPVEPPAALRGAAFANLLS